MQFGANLCITRGKQRDVMTAAHEFFGDVRNNALRTTIKLRRDSFVQGRHLGDAVPVWMIFKTR
jgi:hypothetical protein